MRMDGARTVTGVKRLKVFFLDRSTGRSLQSQLVEVIKKLIRDGELAAAEALPSSRELAETLKVSRNTVVYAYDRLISEGYLESTQRSGIFVASTADALQATAAAAASSKHRPVRPQLSLLNSGLSKGPTPFRPSQPDVTLFPMPVWNRMRSQAIRAHGSRLLNYNAGATLGLRELRQHLADYLSESRGVRCEWWQIAITSGSQQAIYLLAQLLLQPGDTVFMEDPGYAGANRAWTAARANVRYFAMDDEGVTFPPFSPAVKLAYVTPSRQLPLGVSLSLRRRLAVVASAAETGTWVIEDDYDSEFRYVAPPVPSLQSLDNANRIIYVGTFSKLLFPSLRLGYAVLPPALVDSFAELRATAEEHGPMIEQATLARFLDSSDFFSHIRRCRRHYAERQSVFLDAAKKANLPFHFPYTDGGMNLTGLLTSRQNDLQLSDRLTTAGLDVPALSAYQHKNELRGLVFGFTAFTPERIRRGVHLVEKTLLSPR
jgi:GntR family transcriptional regulator/MocR family aminotransferase